MARQNVFEFENRNIREARKGLEDHCACVEQCQVKQAELRLTIMETRIRLAEVLATLRQISPVIGGLPQ